jgi:hypothetical protein
VTVGSFYDANPNAAASDLSATINWGDGHVSAGIVTASSTTPGLFLVSGTNTYATPGPYTITVSVADQKGDTTTITSTANVTAPVLTPKGNTVYLTAGVLPASPVTVGSFYDANPNAAASDLSATIHWGDGNVSPGTVTASPTTPGLFLVSGTNLYTTPGTYTITVSVQDQKGNSTTITSTAIVNTNMVYGFTGKLADVVSNGPYRTLGYTNTNRPTFSGTAAPFSIVQLYARHFGIDAVLPLGQAVTDGNGQWMLTVGPLAHGNYHITATVTPAGGYPSAMMPLANNGVIHIYMTPRHARVLLHPIGPTKPPGMTKGHGARHHTV